MNRSLLLPAAVSLACMLPAPLPAQEDDPFAPGAQKPDRQIGILLEWIQLDHREANKIIRKHAGKVDASAFREELEKLLDAGTAELIESAHITTRDGQRAKVESVDEVIYPDAFQYPPPPAHPNPAATKGEGVSGQFPITPPVSTSFDERNVGTTVEVDPTISYDGKTIDLNIAPEIVYHIGDRHYEAALPPEGKVGPVSQPAFYTLRMSTALTLGDGETAFAGQLTPPKKLGDGKRVLLFIKADVLK